MQLSRNISSLTKGDVVISGARPLLTACATRYEKSPAQCAGLFSLFI